jgi:hypothetical protein
LDSPPPPPPPPKGVTFAIEERMQTPLPPPAYTMVADILNDDFSH